MSNHYPKPSEGICRAVFISIGGWTAAIVVVAVVASLLLSGCAGYVEQQGCNGLIGAAYRCK